MSESKIDDFAEAIDDLKNAIEYEMIKRYKPRVIVTIKNSDSKKIEIIITATWDKIPVICLNVVQTVYKGGFCPILRVGKSTNARFEDYMKNRITESEQQESTEYYWIQTFNDLGIECAPYFESFQEIATKLLGDPTSEIEKLIENCAKYLR